MPTFRSLLPAATILAILGPPAAPCQEPANGSGGDQAAVRTPSLDDDILPLLKRRCVKCHGPAKQEGGLRLSTSPLLARGGESGPIVVPGDVTSSLLWQRIDDDEMPPDDPLPPAEKELLRRWIAGGANGLPEASPADDLARHWAFERLVRPSLPAVIDETRVQTTVDRFTIARLEAAGLALNSQADRRTLIRRVAYDVTGLPPTPAEIQRFVDDTSPDAYAQMVDRYLASPHYGQRWGKHWLDAAGYADSNGYFSADTDRPLAYRYRDYVVRSINADKPFDRFVVEQLAGDELSRFAPGNDASAETISLLEATHYLRNGQDGTGESDGNPDEVRIDRYFVLESTMQIVASSLLGLTLQCAKCHDHKFEAITQRDYYQLQSVFYPALNVEDWTKPNDRHLHASLPGELRHWEQQRDEIERDLQTARETLAAWRRDNPLPRLLLFHDDFQQNGPPLADQWSNTAPTDDAPGGVPPVMVEAAMAPSAQRRDEALAIVESGGSGDRWLSTRQSFDWTPDAEGDWIQATFDLVDDKVDSDGPAAARIAYFVALHDFDDSTAVTGGNLLVDGNPAGGANLHLDYPGSDARILGTLGGEPYVPGRNYGVRITNVGEGKYRLEHVVDRAIDGEPIELTADDLPDGGFGFEYCCGRSFVVDNVTVEQSPTNEDDKRRATQLADQYEAMKKELLGGPTVRQKRLGPRPGKIACVFERSADAPDVFLLARGNYGSPTERVEPAPLAALAELGESLAVEPITGGAQSSGRRLAWARWVTRPGSRASALLARVQVNRIWQNYLGTGIVATSDNLGASGAAPSHPALLEHLAWQFVAGGWRAKALHREILLSATYRQSSMVSDEARRIDPDNRLVSRFGVRRLDGEALRDAMLAVSGSLDRRFGGPYVPTQRDAAGAIIVAADQDGADRRSLYLQQRRTQTLSFLGVFDSPSIVFNCVKRPTSTVPLQSLSLLNSRFLVEQAAGFAERILRDEPDDQQRRIRRAFVLATAREPTPPELSAAEQFLVTQCELYAGADDAQRKTWSDLCQMILASSAFLYVE